MFIQTGVYLLLALYIDAIHPGGEGAAEHWLFFISVGYLLFLYLHYLQLLVKTVYNYKSVLVFERATVFAVVQELFLLFTRLG